MFSNKKNVKIDTMQDKKIKELRTYRHDAWNRVEEAAETVIILNGAIDIYPEGADKEEAKQDAENARQHLINIIAVYNDLCNQYKQAFEEPYERITTKDWECIIKSSHKIVEEVYKNFFKKT